MRYIALFIAMFAGFSIPANAQDCDPIFVNSDQSIVIDGVSIAPGAIATRDLRVRVKNDASEKGPQSGACPATIRFARISPPSHSEIPPYTLRGPSGQVIEILPDRASAGTASSDLTISNTPRGAQGRSVPLQVALRTEWGVRAGTYTDQLEMLLFDDQGNFETVRLTVTIVIPATVSLRLVGAVLGGGLDGPAQVDLGALSSSRSTQADNFGARIFSTSYYSVRLTSSNTGNLSHETADETIAYKLFFDGSLTNLASGAEYTYAGPTSQQGDFRPMRIVVDPTVALAGSYADRITVTVTAM